VVDHQSTTARNVDAAPEPGDAALVSIVLPTHNGARYLRESIDSCLAQTYANLELIVVVDGSRDETLTILKSYDDRRLSTIVLPNNVGLPRALNIGFARARGALLSWTSDDNRFRAVAIAEMVDVLKSRADVDIVYSDFSEIDQGGRAIPPLSWTGVPEDIIRFNCVGPCFLYRRQVQESLGGYDDAMRLAEDYDFWLRAAVLFRMTRLRRNLYLYRRHPNSLTERYRERALAASDRALGRSLPKFQWVPGPTRASLYLWLAGRAWERNEISGARAAVVQALCRSPRLALRETPPRLLAAALLGERAAEVVRWIYRFVRYGFRRSAPPAPR
jgi:glycosyltransferase involved in cell wall biosynthesis